MFSWPYWKTGGGQHHAQRAGFAAARAGAGPAYVEQGSLGQHHVRQRLLVDEFLRRLGHVAVEVEGGLVELHVVISLADHAQGVVVAAGVHAFGAALALGGIDEDAELSAAEALLLEDGVVLLRLHPLGAHGSTQRLVGDFRQPIVECGGLCHFAEDGRVRTLRDAIHAPDAVFDHELRDVLRDVTEIAERSGTRGDKAAGYHVVGVQAFFRGSIVISANYALVEVSYIHYVEFDIVDPFVQSPEDGFHYFSLDYL